MNNRIHVVAPASGVSPARLQRLKDYLSPFNAIIPEQLVNSECLFHACSDESRFDHLVAALYDDEPVPIVWALRGGYGSARLLERLYALPKPKTPKTFIGFSDTTALHLFLSQFWQWRTIHAAGLAQLVDDEPRDLENFARVAAILNQQTSQQTLSALKPLNQAALNTPRINGYMQGGNLTLVECSIGTCWQARTSGALLFLEDVGEKGYRIDRSLLHLKQAGLLSEVNAVIFGEFLGPDEEGIAYALQRFAQDIETPVYQTNQFGHGKMNYPIVYHTQPF